MHRIAVAGVRSRKAYLVTSGPIIALPWGWLTGTGDSVPLAAMMKTVFESPPETWEELQRLLAEGAQEVGPVDPQSATVMAVGGAFGEIGVRTYNALGGLETLRHPEDSDDEVAPSTVKLAVSPGLDVPTLERLAELKASVLEAPRFSAAIRAMEECLALGGAEEMHFAMYEPATEEHDVFHGPVGFASRLSEEAEENEPGPDY